MNGDTDKNINAINDSDNKSISKSDSTENVISEVMYQVTWMLIEI